MPAFYDGRELIHCLVEEMKLSKALLPVAISLALFGAGCSFTHTVNVNVTANKNANTATVNTKTTVTKSVTYTGQAGKNALELLQAKHTVDASAQGFVNAIDGVKPGDHQYWSFYVNNKQADVGAKDYQTKNDDAIEWKLESF